MTGHVLKHDAPLRSVTEVGKGDFVKIDGVWKTIVSNTACGKEHPLGGWVIRTADGATYGMYDIKRYAKACDLE